jgi:hypothetical protein
MATKREEFDLMAMGKGCLGKAADDEPLFILRAHDPAAPLAVRIWCNIARFLACHEAEKIADAEGLAMRMQTWRISRGLTALFQTGPRLAQDGDDD